MNELPRPRKERKYNLSNVSKIQDIPPQGDYMIHELVINSGHRSQQSRDDAGLQTSNLLESEFSNKDHLTANGDLFRSMPTCHVSGKEAETEKVSSQSRSPQTTKDRNLDSPETNTVENNSIKLREDRVILAIEKSTPDAAPIANPPIVIPVIGDDAKRNHPTVATTDQVHALMPPSNQILKPGNSLISISEQFSGAETENPTLPVVFSFQGGTPQLEPRTKEKPIAQQATRLIHSHLIQQATFGVGPSEADMNHTSKPVVIPDQSKDHLSSKLPVDNDIADMATQQQDAMHHTVVVPTDKSLKHNEENDVNPSPKQPAEVPVNKVSAQPFIQLKMMQQGSNIMPIEEHSEPGVSLNKMKTMSPEQTPTNSMPPLQTHASLPLKSPVSPGDKSPSLAPSDRDMSRKDSKSVRGEAQSHRGNLEKMKKLLDHSLRSGGGTKRSGSFMDNDEVKSVKSHINEDKMKRKIKEQFPSNDMFLENASGRSEDLNDQQANYTQKVKVNQIIDNKKLIDRIARGEGHTNVHHHHQSRNPHMTTEEHLQELAKNHKQDKPLMSYVYPRLALVMTLMLFLEISRKLFT